MTLSPQENLLAEAIKNMLDDEALGSATHKDRRKEERAHTFTFLHEEIEQAYRLEVITLEHHEDICSAFSKIHSHKYLDDPSFPLAFKKELTARAVPMEEQDAALKAMGRITDRLMAEMNEKDAGWNPDLDEIIAASQPEQIAEGKGAGILTEDAYLEERLLFRDPKFRRWVEGQQDFWEAINKRIRPQLEHLGYKADSSKAFWEVYDTEAAEFVIGPMMHELHEEFEARFAIVEGESPHKSKING